MKELISNRASPNTHLLIGFMQNNTSAGSFVVEEFKYKRLVFSPLRHFATEY